LEQLFEWNYRFAKETAGNLSMMQQKLIESQMLAAQLMIGSSPNSPPSFGLGFSELLARMGNNRGGIHHQNQTGNDSTTASAAAAATATLRNIPNAASAAASLDLNKLMRN
jgi:hypothetical protein